MSDLELEVLGRYRILKLLGSGAMGVVYQAVDPVIDRVVAIKTINLRLTKDEMAEYEARFNQEIKAAGKLNHPNIVTIYDVGRTDQFAYMAMEFIDGAELKTVLKRDEPLPVMDGVRLIANVADGLAFAHARDIVHRDVKPSNIMVGESEDGLVAKIMDFGIARMPTSTIKTLTGMVLGSPRYMSPEQVIGKPLDARTDIFSLGVVLHEVLTGSAPFDGPSINSIMYATVNNPAAAPSESNPKVPAELDAIVAKALAKQPAERYATMREFAKALHHAARMLEENAWPPAPPKPKPDQRLDPVIPADESGPWNDPPSFEDSSSQPMIELNLDPATPQPSFQLADQFDSTAGTLRLAALTGQSKAVAALAKTSRATPASLDAANQQISPAPVVRPSAPPTATPTRTPAGEPEADLLDGQGLATAAAAPAPHTPVLPILLLGTLSLIALGLLIALLI